MVLAMKQRRWLSLTAGVRTSPATQASLASRATSVVMSMAVLGLGANAKAQSDRARPDIGREQRGTQKFVAQLPEKPPTPNNLQRGGKSRNWGTGIPELLRCVKAVQRQPVQICPG